MTARNGKRKRPKRPFIIEVVGLPGSGKTTFVKVLMPMMKKFDISTAGMNQDSQSADPVTLCAMQITKGVNRKARSLFQRGLLIIRDEQARGTLHDIVLFEHGLNFTWLMERYWAGISAERLMKDMEDIFEPDLAICLLTTPQVVRNRAATRVLRQIEPLLQMFEDMKEMAERKQWICIDTAGNIAPEIIALQAHEAILAAFDKHLKCPFPQKKFKP
jgi:adenylate kinase family enzyme